MITHGEYMKRKFEPIIGGSVNIKCFFGYHDVKVFKVERYTETYFGGHVSKILFCCKRCKKIIVKTIDGHVTLEELEELYYANGLE